MKKSIKLLTEYFHPEPASTGQLMAELAVGLKDKDFNVEVYTLPFPPHPQITHIYPSPNTPPKLGLQKESISNKIMYNSKNNKRYKGRRM